MFSQFVIESLEYYVYCLTDPTKNNEVFYIGKGVGNRVFNHVECALSTQENCDKLDRIRAIKGTGASVGHYIIRHGMNEPTSFEVEASLIDFADQRKLTNQQGGHHSEDFGMKTADEITAMYEAAEFSTDKNVILINLNKLYDRQMTPKQLYEATRTSWVIGKRREKAQFAIATYRGLTREVYTINDWYSIVDEKGKQRWGFNGQVAEPAIRQQLRYKDISKLFKRGAANPIKYQNC
jgi:hypothetical protein